jgi:hypothetical protein
MAHFCRGSVLFEGMGKFRKKLLTVEHNEKFLFLKIKQEMSRFAYRAASGYDLSFLCTHL